MIEFMIVNIPNDAEFPQMPRALDMSLMRETLQRAFFEERTNGAGSLSIQGCQIGERRYKPGKSFVILYRLQILNGATGWSRVQLVCGRLCKKGEGLPEFERATSKNLFGPESVPPVVYVPELEMVLWSFPNDRKLAQLPRMFDLAFLYDRLPKMIVSLDLRGTHPLRHIEAEPLHYLPERSCMVRYRLELENSVRSAIHPLTIYGKIYRDESGSQVYRIMRELSDQAETCANASPLGYDPELKVLWQSEMPGVRFMWDEIKGSHCLEVMARIAACVAAFHSSDVSTQSQFNLENIKALLRETNEAVTQTHPEFAERIGRIIHTLLDQSDGGDFSQIRATPIHRDLKMGNFLIDGEEVGLLDMDCVCIGDPLTDIGSFVANFYVNGMGIGCDEERIEEVVNAFCRAYSEHVTWEVSRARLHWYIASSFVYETIRRAIQQWRGDWMGSIDRYLNLSERYCSLH